MKIPTRFVYYVLITLTDLPILFLSIAAVQWSRTLLVHSGARSMPLGILIVADICAIFSALAGYMVLRRLGKKDVFATKSVPKQVFGIILMEVGLSWVGASFIELFYAILTNLSKL